MSHLEDRVFASERPDALFWPIQTVGWAFFFAINVLGLAVLDHLQPSFLLGYAATTLCGFGVTLLIRAAWRPWLASCRGPFQTAFGLLLTSAGAALVLLAAVTAMEFLPWAFTRVVGPSSFRSLGQQYYWAFLLCLTWSLFYLGYHEWRRDVGRRAETARALALSESAKLQQFRFRVNPRFLFDSLEALRARIVIDRQAARSLVAELAEFLRYGLLHPLLSPVLPADEFQAVRHYLAVRDIGRDGEVRSESVISGAGETSEIPAFILLLLVERAMIMTSAGGPVRLRVDLTDAPESGLLRIEAVCERLPAESETRDISPPALDFTTDFLKHLTESQDGRFVYREGRRAGESVAVLEIGDFGP